MRIDDYSKMNISIFAKNSSLIVRQVVMQTNEFRISDAFLKQMRKIKKNHVVRIELRDHHECSTYAYAGIEFILKPSRRYPLYIASHIWGDIGAWTEKWPRCHEQVSRTYIEDFILDLCKAVAGKKYETS